jgi:hypothetical protein
VRVCPCHPLLLLASVRNGTYSARGAPQRRPFRGRPRDFTATIVPENEAVTHGTAITPLRRECSHLGQVPGAGKESEEMGTGRVVPPHGIPGKFQPNRPGFSSPGRGSGVVQPMAVPPSQAKPAPPPPYRPQHSPVVMQARFSHANPQPNSPKRTPPAPPVFRPQTPPPIMQPKLAAVANLHPATARPPHALGHSRMPALASSSGRGHGAIQRKITLGGTTQTTVPPITEHLTAHAPGNTVTAHPSYAQIVTGMLTDVTPYSLNTGPWGKGQRDLFIAAIQAAIDKAAAAAAKAAAEAAAAAEAEAAAAAALQLQLANQAADALKRGFGSIEDWNTLKGLGHAPAVTLNHSGEEPKPGHASAHVACYNITWTTSTGHAARWCLHIHFLNGNRTAANVESAHFKRLKNHVAGNNAGDISGDRAMAVVKNESA